MAIKAYSYAKDGSKALSKNFHVREFQCKDHSDPIFIDDELVTLLQKIRDHFGKAVNINSAFRTASHNARQKKASKHSQHLYGKAADIWIAGRTGRLCRNSAARQGRHWSVLHGRFRSR